ncbi:MAG: sulfite oxidase [Geminicoccaceae bacterium]|nr:sulfite oxidase [Geminicoccaceae bacterium]
MKIERGLNELYRKDPERADALVFGRRGVLKGASLAAVRAALGGLAIPFARFMPEGYLPVALAAEGKFEFPGKHPGLVLLSDKPLVAETPAHLLDDPVTPTDRLFIRNNGGVPEMPADPNGWKIKIDGEVNNPLELTLGELKSRFPRVEGVFMLECGGNGRSQFVPQARGNPWTTGGAGCPRWAGVRLKDVLQAAGLKSSAVYTAHYGADPHLSGDPTKVTLSRGVRLAKAMDENSILAYEMNGEPLPLVHGGPVRLVFPGWAASASHKWLTRIWIRDKEHDGPGMTGTSYRVPTAPIVPGSDSKGEGFRVLESMPVRSIVTSPADGTRLPAGTREIAARGHAWAGDLEVKEVWTSIDFGATWQQAELDRPVNRHAWQNWRQTVKLPTHGYYELWVRAVDANGTSQPFMAGNWNPQGYGGNAYHRVALLVAAA